MDFLHYDTLYRVYNIMTKLPVINLGHIGIIWDAMNEKGKIEFQILVC